MKYKDLINNEITNILNENLIFFEEDTAKIEIKINHFPIPIKIYHGIFCMDKEENSCVKPEEIEKEFSIVIKFIRFKKESD